MGEKSGRGTQLTRELCSFLAACGGGARGSVGSGARVGGGGDFWGADAPWGTAAVGAASGAGGGGWEGRWGGSEGAGRPCGVGWGGRGAKRGRVLPVGRVGRVGVRGDRWERGGGGRMSRAGRGMGNVGDRALRACFEGLADDTQQRGIDYVSPRLKCLVRGVLRSRRELDDLLGGGCCCVDACNSGDAVVSWWREGQRRGTWYGQGSTTPRT